MYVPCDSITDKFILLFSFYKLGVFHGKTVVLCSDIVLAYKLKLFLNKFSIKCFVLAPDMPKKDIKSLIHFFNTGQYEIVVML